LATDTVSVLYSSNSLKFFIEQTQHANRVTAPRLARYNQKIGKMEFADSMHASRGSNGQFDLDDEFSMHGDMEDDSPFDESAEEDIYMTTSQDLMEEDGADVKRQRSTGRRGRVNRAVIPSRDGRGRGKARRKPMPMLRSQDWPTAELDEVKRKRTSKVIIESPSLDLEVYANNYSGHTKIDRLVFIAERCPSLAIEAYNLALIDLKKEPNLNTQKYLSILNKLNELLLSRGETSVSQDSAWTEAVNRTVSTQQQKLENDLKNYRNNMIKESIRVCIFTNWLISRRLDIMSLPPSCTTVEI
jgi:hypothetical protein